MDEISQLPYDPDEWGMIHADLHVGNFLVNDQEIIPIDFSFCGYGHYLYDLSVCLTGGLKPRSAPGIFARLPQPARYPGGLIPRTSRHMP